ncbi:INO80 complex subunit 1 [Ceratocystis lukuohia]|uniref:INO80 complex subunit 1 n=1 Tax=Ceratocystis lukuohia TaxID=2019550 RepID=A0ABR4MB29_9PEZI
MPALQDDTDTTTIAASALAHSPDTSLSDVLSDADESDVASRVTDTHSTDVDPTSLRHSRSKRLKTEVVDDAPPPAPASPAIHAHEDEHAPEFLDGMSDVSSDTDGDIPSSPANTRFDDDDFQEQVSCCAWEGCNAGDQGNMDRLVDHIHNEHIEGRQRKYTCEWTGCSRKSMAHASGYALKAHMRSHTREKPFYCYLPECDRAFTRSDALAKHMRTVHQTEDLRPSDPVPKSHLSGGPNGRKLKIILKTPTSTTSNDESLLDDSLLLDDLEGDHFTQLSEEDFTKEELEMPLEKLFRRCRLQLQWSEEEGEKLLKEIQIMEETYKREWLDKEVLLAQVIQSEKAWYERRKIVLAAEAKAEAEALAARKLREAQQLENEQKAKAELIKEATANALEKQLNETDADAALPATSDAVKDVSATDEKDEDVEVEDADAEGVEMDSESKTRENMGISEPEADEDKMDLDTPVQDGIKAEPAPAAAAV